MSSAKDNCHPNRQKSGFALIKALPYFLGSAFCVSLVLLFYRELGYLTFFVGFFGLILMERCVYTTLGMKAK